MRASTCGAKTVVILVNDPDWQTKELKAPSTAAP
jgi:hypothetical protein